MADLTSRQAAERLGVALNTLHRLANAGEVPCYRTAGGHRRFREEDVDAALERRAAGEVANADVKAEAWKRAALALLDAADRDLGSGPASGPFREAANALRSTPIVRL